MCLQGVTCIKLLNLCALLWIMYILGAEHAPLSPEKIIYPFLGHMATDIREKKNLIWLHRPVHTYFEMSHQITKNKPRNVGRISDGLKLNFIVQNDISALKQQCSVNQRFGDKSGNTHTHTKKTVKVSVNWYISWALPRMPWKSGTFFGNVQVTKCHKSVQTWPEKKKKNSPPSACTFSPSHCFTLIHFPSYISQVCLWVCTCVCVCLWLYTGRNKRPVSNSRCSQWEAKARSLWVYFPNWL